MRGFYDWLGLSNEYLLRGKNAGMFRETEKFTPEERAKFEDWIKNNLLQRLRAEGCQGPGKGRGLYRLNRPGRVWTGFQGKERGLVDEFGGLDRAIEVAKDLAKIPKDKGVHRVILPYPRTFIQELLSEGDETSTQMKQQEAVLATLPEDARRAVRYMALLDRMKSGESMLLMPFDLRIKYRRQEQEADGRKWVTLPPASCSCSLSYFFLPTAPAACRLSFPCLPCRAGALPG